MANTLQLGNGKWATGKDTVLSFNDENGNFKPLPFSFSRASSATVVNQSGLIETVGSGEPRIDFLGNTKGAMLLEPSRTNLFPYSEDFSQWSLAGGSSISSNQSISPDGTLTADNVSSGEVYVSGVGSSGNTYTFSCYYKGNVGETFVQNVYDGSNHNRFTRTFNGQWQRFSITVTLTNSGIFYLVDDRTGGNSLSFSAWGAQVEAGSYATSYIPTSGSAVTRVAESCYQGGLLDKGVLNNTALTLFFNSTLTSDTTNQYLEVINLYNLSNGNKIRLETRTNNIIHVQQSGVVNSGDNFNSASLGSNSINFKKIAIVLTQTQFKIFANGNQINTTYNGSYNVNLNSLGFRGDNNSVETKIQNKEIKLYNTALTDQELIALTTI